MLRPATTARRWVLVAGGISGVVAAHVLAYVLAFSDAGARAQALHRTGHGYFPVAGWVAGAVAAVSVALVLLRAARHRLGPAQMPDASLVPGVAPLAVWQAALFLAVETVERLAARVPLTEIVHGHEVLIGLAVQVVVAAAIVWLLRGSERLGLCLARRRRPAPAPQRTCPHARLRATAPRPRIARSDGRPRAPPTPARPRPSCPARARTR